MMVTWLRYLWHRGMRHSSDGPAVVIYADACYATYVEYGEAHRGGVMNAEDDIPWNQLSPELVKEAWEADIKTFFPHVQDDLDAR